MSLSNDFEMYFNGTYIGVTVDGVTYPFYVERVSSNFRGEVITEGHYSDEDEEAYIEPVYSPTSDPYGPAAERALVFHGQRVTNAEGRTTEMSVTLGDGTLVLENPELGYIKVRDVWKWLTMVPHRTVKKGLTGRRIQNGDFTSRDAFATWFPSDERICKDMVVIDGILEYKGGYIGEVSGNTLSLEPEAEYLVKLIEEHSSFAIEIKES